MTLESHQPLSSSSPGSPATNGAPPERHEVDERYRWDRSAIFPSWEEWQAACKELGERIEAVEGFRGTLAEGGERLLAYLRLSDEAGKLAYRVWYFPYLAYDEDQRDNENNGRRQRVQALLARWQQAEAWFKPELLSLEEETVMGWFDEVPGLELYRFRLEELYRLRPHVLGDEGERVLSFGSRFNEAPDDAYSALSTADMRYPEIELSSGERVTVTYGKYRTILATNRVQADRRAAFEALYDTFSAHLNTYAALYNGVCQRDWFLAAARQYDTTLDAALFGHDIPTGVVEQLIATTRAGVGPLQRYHRLRQRVLQLDEYHLFDGAISLVEDDARYPYDEAVELVLASVEPLGEGYHRAMKESFEGHWVDVYENKGKRSGAYSAGVYGVHPYVLLNYNDTLDDLFTLAHEMGHSMHSVLAFESQPFVYASYSIFVAEVASTLNESLLLDLLLARTEDPGGRVVLLQHAIDRIVATFYTQVSFAEWELEAHRLAEGGEPITADALSALYQRQIEHFYGEAVTLDERYRFTWARIPHFFASPYYVYQYATSFAASTQIARDLEAAPTPAKRNDVVARYLELLRSGGNDHPMTLLAKAGVDLAHSEPVEAVVARLGELVDQLEAALLT